MRVSFTDESRSDLRAITVFIAQDSPGRAAQFVLELEAACLSLSDNPRRYALIPNFERQGYRRRPFGHYAIIYTTDNDIQIVRVLHSAMDLTVALGD